MATTKSTPIQLLRSEVLNKRPDPTKLLPGQGAINTNSAQPGLFFADNTGTGLVKVGPCTVGTSSPNTGATAPGALGNTLGELWLDTNVTATKPAPVLKVWDGTNWISCMPYVYANTVISPTTPSITDYPVGTLWWNSATGLLYTLYNDGVTSQWAQISNSTVS